MTDSWVLSARGLEKRFGPVAALRGIDLKVDRGSVLAILGPNGAGKSTLLKIAAGLVHPTAGSLELRAGPGHEGTTLAGIEARAQVGYVGHATLLYPELTARENLILAGRLHSLPAPDRRADQLLGEEGLFEVAHRPIRTFSRGMAQRLAIARALVHDPQLVLLDEPFTGLDQPSADRLAARIRSLEAAGHTLMVATHDLARACDFAETAIVIARGRVVHHSGPGDLDPAALGRAYAAALVPPP